VLIGLVLLASAGCGSGSSSRSIGLATPGSSAPASGPTPSASPVTMSPVTMSPTTGAVPTSAAAEALCAGDQAAARTVAVYRAMLTDKGSPVEPLGKPSRLYVSSQWLDDSFLHPGARVGRIAPAVLDCLSAGVPGLPPITVVSGPEDATIATVATQGIRGFADHAKYVTFGDVTRGDTVTSYVTVDAGGGDVAGGRCVVRLHGLQVVSLSSNQSWIS
jgi:hypothetical protein